MAKLEKYVTQSFLQIVLGKLLKQMYYDFSLVKIIQYRRQTNMQLRSRRTCTVLSRKGVKK